MVRVLQETLAATGKPQQAFDSVGNAVDTGQWNMMQISMASDCPLVRWESGANTERCLMSWSAAFAKLVSVLCKGNKVPVDIFQREFGMALRSPVLLEHVKRHRYFLSEAHGADVGLDATLATIEARIERLCIDGREMVRMRLFLPHVRGRGSSEILPVDFTLQDGMTIGNRAEVSLARMTQSPGAI